jgi:hypothetical protein
MLARMGAEARYEAKGRELMAKMVEGILQD